MIATIKSIAGQSGVGRQSRGAEQRLRERARRLLGQEIAFISNAAFRELDVDEVWQQMEGATGGGEFTPAGLIGRGGPGMPAHLERMCAAPLLTPSQERELFCHMNYFRYRANSLRAALQIERATRTQLDEIERLLNQATLLRNRIIHANIRLVVSIVKQLADSRNRFDELLSEGISCLIKAVDKFDFDRGFRFSTYATRAVRREVFRLVQRQHRQWRRYATGSQELLGQQVNRETEPEGIEMSWPRLDESVERLLSGLDDREKFIVGARYGFDDLGEKPTFQRLGELLGVSKERVRQIEQRALTKLRGMAQEMRLEPAN